MTNTRTRALALAAIAALAVMHFSPAEVQAQSRITVNIPFDFHVGSQKLPAGRYAVGRATDPAVLRISDDNGHAALTLSNGLYDRSAKRRARLIFSRYGDRYFLSEVHWEDSPVSRQLMKSSLEIEIARNVAAQRIATAPNNR